MPRFDPFTAIRYTPGRARLDDVIAPPYDVLSDADRADLAARHDRNIVHIDLPDEQDGPGRYAAAAVRLADWLADGTLSTDPVPSFTIYRMQFVDEAGRARSTVGVIGGLEVVDEGAGGVLPHERTTPKAKTDRLDLTRATRANLSPIWGLSLTAGLSDLLAEPGDPMGDVTVDGVRHVVERVDDPARVREIGRAVGASSVLIADGHHRYAIARTYRDEWRLAADSTNGAAELTMTYVGELVEDQLSIEAIHRLVGGVSVETLEARLRESFESEALGEITPGVLRTMDARGCLCLVRADGTGALLRPRERAFPGVRDLDSARLEHALVGLDAELAYQHGVGNVLDRLAHDHTLTGVLIRPVGIGEIRRTADERLLMPPKSTFFTPKLRTGLAIRPM